MCDVGKDEVFNNANLTVPKTIKVSGEDFKSMITDLLKEKEGIELSGKTITINNTCSTGGQPFTIDLTKIIDENGIHFHDYNVNKVLVVNYINMHIDRMVLCEGKDEAERKVIHDKFIANLELLAKDHNEVDPKLKKEEVEEAIGKINNLLVSSKTLVGLIDKGKLESLRNNIIKDIKEKHNVHCVTLAIYANYVLSRMLLLAYHKEYDVSSDEIKKVKDLVFGDHENVIKEHLKQVDKITDKAAPIRQELKEKVQKTLGKHPSILIRTPNLLDKHGSFKK